MAADGPTDREIGQKLYISHRTVASRLYRILPEVDIASRTQVVSRPDSD